MARYGPVLLLVLVLVLGGVIAFLLFGGTKKQGHDADEAGERAAVEGTTGELIGVGPDARNSDRGRERVDPAPEPKPTSADVPLRRFLAGVVRDDTDGTPIAGASLNLFPHAEPCPRLDGWLLAGPVTTDAEGKFA